MERPPFLVDPRGKILVGIDNESLGELQGQLALTECLDLLAPFSSEEIHGPDLVRRACELGEFIKVRPIRYPFTGVANRESPLRYSFGAKFVGVSSR